MVPACGTCIKTNAISKAFMALAFLSSELRGVRGGGRVPIATRSRVDRVIGTAGMPRGESCGDPAVAHTNPIFKSPLSNRDALAVPKSLAEAGIVDDVGINAFECEDVVLGLFATGHVRDVSREFRDAFQFEITPVVRYCSEITVR